MSLISGIVVNRKPNVGGFNRFGDDLSFRMPKGFIPMHAREALDLKPGESNATVAGFGGGEYDQNELSYIPNVFSVPTEEISLGLDDKVVAITGDSGSGKSTFLRSLVHSIQNERKEPVTHGKFNGIYNTALVLKVLPALDIFGISLKKDTRTRKELYQSLKGNLGSELKCEEFVNKLQEELHDLEFDDCLRMANFVYEAGPWLINSGVVDSAFSVNYHGDRPDAWYYNRSLSPHNEGSDGQQNFEGLKLFERAVGDKDIICLDDPEISLDRTMKQQLVNLIKQYEGQVFIATHDAYLIEIANQEIRFG